MSNTHHYVDDVPQDVQTVTWTKAAVDQLMDRIEKLEAHQHNVIFGRTSGPKAPEDMWFGI